LPAGEQRRRARPKVLDEALKKSMKGCEKRRRRLLAASLQAARSRMRMKEDDEEDER
jgi:hypothetical protein